MITQLNSFTNPTMHSPISHNAPFRTEMYTFLFWMVHCVIWERLIVGFVRLVFSLMGPMCLWASVIKKHDDVIKWKHFPRYWPFVRGIHRSPVNSPHKGQWRRALMFSLIFARINGWVNNGEAGDLRCYCAHYDVTVMIEHILAKLCTHA